MPPTTAPGHQQQPAAAGLGSIAAKSTRKTVRDTIARFMDTLPRRRAYQELGGYNPPHLYRPLIVLSLDRHAAMQRRIVDECTDPDRLLLLTLGTWSSALAAPE